MTEIMAAQDGSGLVLGRKVVRCRDCANAEPIPASELPWLPGEAAEQAEGFFGCSHFARVDGGRCIVEADGFCSWGREGE